MRRLLLVLALLGGTAFAQAPAYVQSAGTFPAGSTANVTMTLTAGNLVVIYVRSSGSLDTFTVSTSKSDTVSSDISCLGRSNLANQTLQIWWIASAVGGSTTITMTSVNGASFVGLAAAEYSGQYAASVWDGCSVTYNNNSSGNITTTVANDLLVGIGNVAAGTGSTPTVTAGYTLRQRNLSSGTFFDGYWDNTLGNSIGSYSFNVSGSPTYSGIAAFKPVGAAPPASATQIGIFAVGP